MAFGEVTVSAVLAAWFRFTVAWNWKVAVAPGAREASMTLSADVFESSTVGVTPPDTLSSELAT